MSASLGRTFCQVPGVRAQHLHTEAILEYETVIAPNRNWAHEYSHLGWCKLMTEAIEGPLWVMGGGSAQRAHASALPQ